LSFFTLTDSLPVAGKLLDLEQHGDGVQAMARRQPVRDLVVQRRNPTCIVETALPEIRRQRCPQGIRAMIRIADPSKDVKPSSDDGSSIPSGSMSQPSPRA